MVGAGEFMKIKYIGDRSRVTPCEYHMSGSVDGEACHNGCPGHIDGECRCGFEEGEITILDGYDDVFIQYKYNLLPIIPPRGVHFDKYGREIKI